MRQTAASNNGQFRLKVVAGTRTVLMALDCDEARREGLLGFSFYRARQGAANSGKWLRSQKVFKSLVPNPRKKVNGRPPVFTTADHPVQSFLWGDYTAEPGATYEFRIVPAYGRPGALRHEADDEITISVTTELENDPRGHGVWFNRGAIASQHFAREFGDVEPSSQQLEDLTQPVTKWLSRGLAEACLDFINEIPEGEGLRCCLYEFTYKPVLNALKAAIDRGVDVRICFHGTEVNRKAVAAAELRKKVGNVQVLFERTVPKIPHNKFMVRLDKRGQPQSIWTGSTNITSSGFLGQSNVGHRINRHPKLAAKFLEYWEAISKNPKSFPSKEASTKVSPHPVEEPKEGSITPVFSPRHTAGMLQWYANRMVDATQGVMFTAAFGVNEKFVLPLADDRDFLRFVLMEKRPKKDLEDRLRDDRDLVISYGSVLGEAAFIKDG
ncbi:phospholipase D-like domain-containing protein, partial [Ramlibacter sp.]|uniref:phospholipase D-like domain-containing protein n=1 Tax=Ramlibacter sp. TaxID=1917967 RepID=UPI002BE8AFC3